MFTIFFILEWKKNNACKARNLRSPRIQKRRVESLFCWSQHPLHLAANISFHSLIRPDYYKDLMSVVNFGTNTNMSESNEHSRKIKRMSKFLCVGLLLNYLQEFDEFFKRLLNDTYMFFTQKNSFYIWNFTYIWNFFFFT